MNTAEKRTIPGQCNGCERHCKYGYARGNDSKTYPTIAGETQEYYIRPDGLIMSAAITTPAYAQILAHTIAQTCDKYNCR